MRRLLLFSLVAAGFTLSPAYGERAEPVGQNAQQQETQPLDANSPAEQPPPKETRSPESPQTRIALEIPFLGVNYGGGDALFLAGTSLHYYMNPRWAIGLDIMPTIDDEEYGVYEEYLSITHFGMTGLREWTFQDVIRPYVKAGPGAYRFEMDSSGPVKWSGGVMAETGVTFAAARGFSATFGIGFHAVAQPHIPAGPTPSQPGLNDTIRGIWISRFALGWRW